MTPNAEVDAFGVPRTAVLSSWAVHFTDAVPGTYHHVCQIHEGMEGQITVVPRS